MALFAYKERLTRLLRLNQLSVGKKLRNLILFFLLIITGMVLYTSVTLYNQKSDGLIVNIAGRQRMLTQKFTKEFFLSLQQAPKAERFNDITLMTRTRQLFDFSLTALMDGGKTFLDLGMKKPVELPGIRTPAIRKQLEQVAVLWQQLKESVDNIRSGAHDNTGLNDINQLSVKTLAAMNKAVGMLAAEADGKVRTLQLSLLVLLAFTWLASYIVAPIIVFNVTEPLQQVVATAKRIASGDLQSRSQVRGSADELGSLTNQVEKMREALSRVIHVVQQNSLQMAISSKQIAGISSEIAASSTREEKSSRQVLEATESLREISTAVSTRVEDARETVEQTIGQAREGIVVVHRNIEELADTVDSVNTTATRMEALKEATGRIHKIIESIQNIADQTNLLALNATIEAARAGEAGKGFAVVAGEIKDLAKQTAESTTEITELINGLTQRVDSSVNSMQLVVEKVNISQQESEKTVAVFEAMTAGVKRTTETTNRIAEDNHRQAEQLSSLHERLNELFRVLKESSIKAEDTTLVADDLHLVSDRINTVLDEFIVDREAPVTRQPGDKRRYPRIDISIKVRIEQGDYHVTCLSRNLSLRGMSLKSRRQLALNRSLPIRISLPMPGHVQGEETFSLDVRLLREEKEGFYYFYGVEFESVNTMQEMQLKRIFDYFGKPYHYSDDEEPAAAA